MRSGRRRATNAADRKKFEADAELFKSRIAAIMKKTNPKALPAPQAFSGVSEATPSEAKAEPAKADAVMDPPRIRRWSEMTIGQLQAAVMRGG